jgi:hypothetical protein
LNREPTPASPAPDSPPPRRRRRKRLQTTVGASPGTLQVCPEAAPTTVAAIGFSTRRSMPASSNGSDTAACKPVGAATTTASTIPDRSRGSARGRQPWAAATRARDSSMGSTTATSSTSGRAASSFAAASLRLPFAATAGAITAFAVCVSPQTGQAIIPAAVWRS